MLPRGSDTHIYNFAVGGQAIGRMVDRVKQFQSLRTAKLIVVNGGENDLTEGVAVEQIVNSWNQLLKSLPRDIKVLCIGLPVTDGPRVRSESAKLLNLGIARTCASRNASYLEIKAGTGLFRNVDISADQMHLSVAGLKVLADTIDRESK